MGGNSRSEVSPRIITVAGCKGGVGKSIIASALAIEAGRRGLDVILVDADLGGANLHTYRGSQAPEWVISDFLSRRAEKIEQIVLETEFEGVRFISCAGNAPSQANLKFAQKIKIIKSLFSLKADLLVIDIGAGSSYDVMDFFSMTDGGIVVSAPEPASIINSYGFVKNVAYRRFGREFKQNSLAKEVLRHGMNPGAEGGIAGITESLSELTTVNPECWLKPKSVLSAFMPDIIMNRTASRGNGRLGDKLKSIIGEYLSIEARCLGEVVDDPAVRVSARKMVPFTILAPECEAAECIREIAGHLFESKSELSEAPPLEARMA